jgi:hypothetical protein
MQAKSLSFSPIGWVFGTIVLAIGVANLVLVHPVPGVAFLLLSLVYFPPANEFLLKQTGFIIPRFVKIALGIVIIMFTLGVSDLGDIIDGLSRTA